MKLLVLKVFELRPSRGKYVGNPNYRGTDRKWDRALDWAKVPKDQVRDDAFAGWAKLYAEDITPYWEEPLTIPAACDFAKLINRHFHMDVEVVAVVTEEEAIPDGSEFLGFDVSAFFPDPFSHDSLLWTGLELPDEKALRTNMNSEEIERVLPILLVRFRYFMPLLNSNGLFADYETARLYLDCIMAEKLSRKTSVDSVK